MAHKEDRWQTEISYGSLSKCLTYLADERASLRSITNMASALLEDAGVIACEEELPSLGSIFAIKDGAGRKIAFLTWLYEQVKDTTSKARVMDFYLSIKGEFKEGMDLNIGVGVKGRSERKSLFPEEQPLFRLIMEILFESERPLNVKEICDRVNSAKKPKKDVRQGETQLQIRDCHLALHHMRGILREGDTQIKVGQTEDPLIEVFSIESRIPSASGQSESAPIVDHVALRVDDLKKQILRILDDKTSTENPTVRRTGLYPHIHVKERPAGKALMELIASGDVIECTENGEPITGGRRGSQKVYLKLKRRF